MMVRFRFAPLACLAFAAVLSSQEQPAAGDDRQPKIYDLTAVVATRPAAGPDLVLRGPAGKPLEGTAPDSGAGPEGIARLVRAFVKPPLGENEEVKALGERWLVVLGRTAQHAWVERFLAVARGQDEQQFAIRCNMYSMPELVYKTAVEPALDPGSATEADGHSSTVLAPGAATEAFLKALAEHGEVKTLATPSTVVQPLRTAHMSVINQTSYIRDFDVEIASASVIANPVVDVVQDGVTMQVAVTPLREETVGLSVNVKVADLQRPIPTFETTLGVGTQPVTIQLPQLLATEVRAAVALPAGHIVLFALPSLAGVRYAVTLQVSELSLPGGGGRKAGDGKVRRGR